MPATDFTDDRKLAGFAHSIFFGRVEVMEETRRDGPVVETVYEVSVEEQLHNETGQLPDKVRVTQFGGFDPWTFRLVVKDGDLPLEEGSTYLFFTRTNKIDGRTEHYLVSKYGDLEVMSDQHREELRARFLPAIANAVPFGPENLSPQPCLAIGEVREECATPTP